MKTLLVNNIHTLVTMDPTRREISNGVLLTRDHIIEQVGTTAKLLQTADETRLAGTAHRPAQICKHPPSLLSNPHQSHPRRPKQ
jgi:hypothetical protein